MSTMTLHPLGDRAFLARFATESAAASWASSLRSQNWPGVVDVVLAYETAAVFADPDQVDLESLASRLLNVQPASQSAQLGRLIELPVLYDGEDLPEVARALGLRESEVVAAHHDREYRVFAIGFLPGFPYAGYLPDCLTGLPRRGSPRLHVAAGSMAIAGRQTGVYPQESPGGWHVIGRTPLRIVDLAAEHFPIQAGDRLRFIPIDAGEFESRRGDRL
jgi:KipI family sensor histidine kinase inhibitor